MKELNIITGYISMNMNKENLNIRPSKGNNIYTAYGVGSLTPGLGGSWTFDIPNNNRSFYLKSIILNYAIWDLATNRNIPIEQNGSLDFNVIIGANAITPPAKAYNNVVMTGGFTMFNGNAFVLTVPGQYNYEAFFSSNSLDVQVNVTNYDVLISLGFNFSLTVEIELL